MVVVVMVEMVREGVEAIKGYMTGIGGCVRKGANLTDRRDLVDWVRGHPCHRMSGQHACTCFAHTTHEVS